jgi:hypothetical protein
MPTQCCELLTVVGVPQADRPVSTSQTRVDDSFAHGIACRQKNTLNEISFIAIKNDQRQPLCRVTQTKRDRETKRDRDTKRHRDRDEQINRGIEQSTSPPRSPRADLSHEAVASMLRSGAKSHESTHPKCSCSVLTLVAVVTSHRHVTLSAPPAPVRAGC